MVRSMRLRSTAALAVVAVALVARTADAKPCANPLINSCINSDTYWPDAGPMRFATVAGTQTVGSGQIGFGLVASYQSRPVLLHIFSPGPGGSDQVVVNDQATGNFLFAYGVTDRLQLDFALPVTFIQTGAGLSPLTGGEDLRDTAVRDLRFGATYALVPRKRVSPNAYVSGFPKQPGDAEVDPMAAGYFYAVTARMMMSAPTGDSDQFAGERTAVFAPDLAADLRYSRFFGGLDVGARLRPVTEFAGARVGTQVSFGAGLGADILKNDLLSLTAEARFYLNFVEQHDTAQSAFGITSEPNGTHITPAEWLVAAHTAPLLAGDVSFFFGGGGPIPIGEAAITVPRFRFVLGAMYMPTARDTDNDGIPDKVDHCPTVPGIRGGDASGCPKAPEPEEKKP